MLNPLMIKPIERLALSRHLIQRYQLRAVGSAVIGASAGIAGLTVPLLAGAVGIVAQGSARGLSQSHQEFIDGAVDGSAALLGRWLMNGSL